MCCFANDVHFVSVLHSTKPTAVSWSIPNKYQLHSAQPDGKAIFSILITIGKSFAQNLPFTFTRSNSVKSGGNWKLTKAAQWNTQSTPSNAVSIASGSQISPINDTIGFGSAWSENRSKQKKKIIIKNLSYTNHKHRYKNISGVAGAFYFYVGLLFLKLHITRVVCVGIH